MIFSWIFIPIIAVVSAKILTLISTLVVGDLWPIYYSALGFAVVGTVLLFFARLPLYQQGIFWTVGPKLLDRSHRRLYWLAYLLVLVSIGLLAIVWFRLKS